MRYPAFLAAGWPIGDGAIESGNKLVVKARLKGSGMHWAPPHVDPMLALRNIVCNDRWDKAWPQIVRTLRRQAQRDKASAVTNAIGLAAAQPLSQLRQYRALRRHNQPQGTPA